MTLDDLISALQAVKANRSGRADRGLSPVVLIVNGVAHGVDGVWWEPFQGITGSTCVGDDPR